jgi:hypothetical protein
VMVVYAALGVGVTLASLIVPKAKRAVPVVVIAGGLIMGAVYVHVVDRHSGIWGTAFDAEIAGIERIKRQFPALPPESTVIATNYPAYQTLGVPIFASTWDLNGLIKLEYEDGSLSAYPLTAGLELVCLPDGVGMQGIEEAPPTIAPYGKTRILDLQTGRHDVPRSQRQCRAVAKNYVPGPMYIQTEY